MHVHTRRMQALVVMKVSIMNDNGLFVMSVLYEMNIIEFAVAFVLK